MKAEKALEIMDRAEIKNQAEVYYDVDSDGEVKDLEFVGTGGIDRILNLMDKDTAKAPVQKKGFKYYYDCPSCEEPVTFDYEGYLAINTYCDACGQKIDYSECEGVQEIIHLGENKERNK